MNDRFGHGSGDEVLAAVGAVLRSAIRESDFAGRAGGEEFMVLLPSTGEVGALATGEKIRSAVEKIFLPKVDRAITVSIGIGVLPDHADDSDTLERAADRALYMAKANGRNRIEVSTESPPPALRPAADF